MINKEEFSYVKGTVLEEIINRCVDSWARILGFSDPYDRGRESDGTFKADDPSTAINEAWKSGKSPRRPATRKTRKNRKGTQ